MKGLIKFGIIVLIAVVLFLVVRGLIIWLF